LLEKLYLPYIGRWIKLTDMPLTIQTIEELEERVKLCSMPVVDLEDPMYRYTPPNKRMLVDIEELNDLLSAARWALEHNYQPE